MLEKYLELFYAVGTQMVGLIIPVFTLYLVLSLVASLTLDRK